MEFKIGGVQMKKVKGIIGLSMSLIISLGITANVSAGTKDITGTYLKLHVASYKTSGSATTTDRSGNRWVKAWQNSYNQNGVQLSYTTNTSTGSVTASVSGISGNARTVGNGQIRNGTSPGSQLMETQTATAYANMVR